jgi:2-desacetyl-2-hydroxyethyl bacteriochlorophyllide A dehydrogenase
MDEKMRAVVVHTGDQFAYEVVDRPRAGPGEIVLKIEAAGICAADRKIYSKNHPWQLPDPYFPGHEYVGRVVEMGEDATAHTGLALGDRAVAEILVPCRRCWFCHRGLYTHCDDPGVCVGSWAEYMRVPVGAILHQVPDDLLPEEGALIEPLACSIHAVNLAQIQLADVVVVAGLGAIGMGVLQVARLKTPHKLIGLDVDDGLLQIATRLGADAVFNPLRHDIPTELRALTGGRGPDIYIEASGSVTSLRTGLETLRKAGRLVAYGVYSQEATLDFNLVSEFKELEILGGHLSPNTYPLAISYLVEGLVEWKVMVTHTYPLSRFEEAIRVKDQPDVSSIKILLFP